jgi:hypothetical protein
MITRHTDFLVILENRHCGRDSARREKARHDMDDGGVPINPSTSETIQNKQHSHSVAGVEILERSV